MFHIECILHLCLTLVTLWTGPTRFLCLWDSPGSGLPRPPPGNLPNPGIEPTSLVSQADALSLSQRGSPYFILRSDQINSVTQSCPTRCNPMNCSMPGLPVHHQLPEFTETHVH